MSKSFRDWAVAVEWLQPLRAWFIPHNSFIQEAWNQVRIYTLVEWMYMHLMNHEVLIIDMTIDSSAKKHDKIEAQVYMIWCMSTGSRPEMQISMENRGGVRLKSQGPYTDPLYRRTNEVLLYFVHEDGHLQLVCTCQQNVRSSGTVISCIKKNNCSFHFRARRASVHCSSHLLRIFLKSS